MATDAIRAIVAFILTGVGLLGMTLVIASSAHAQLSIADDYVAFPDGTMLRPYEIGDMGPAGGFVFHVTADGLHGLEAAPVDQSTGVEWGCSGTELPRAEGTGIGAGERNTQIILYGCATAGIAAELAADYVSPSGYQDWYLPSKEEMHLMYQNLHLAGLGEFAEVTYWNSSERELLGIQAWAQQFSDGLQGFADKNTMYAIRAVRAF